MKFTCNTTVADLLKFFYSGNVCTAEIIEAFKEYSRNKASQVKEPLFSIRGAHLKDNLIEEYLNWFFSLDALPLYFVFDGVAKFNSDAGKRVYAYGLKSFDSALPTRSFTEKFLVLIALLNIDFEYTCFEERCETSVANNFDEQSPFFLSVVGDVEKACVKLGLKRIHIDKSRWLPICRDYTRPYRQCSAISVTSRYDASSEHPEQHVEYHGSLNILLK